MGKGLEIENPWEAELALFVDDFHAESICLELRGIDSSRDPPSHFPDVIGRVKLSIKDYCQPNYDGWLSLYGSHKEETCKLRMRIRILDSTMVDESAVGDVVGPGKIARSSSSNGIFSDQTASPHRYWISPDDYCASPQRKANKRNTESPQPKSRSQSLSESLANISTHMTNFLFGDSPPATSPTSPKKLEVSPPAGGGDALNDSSREATAGSEDVQWMIVNLQQMTSSLQPRSEEIAVTAGSTSQAETSSFLSPSRASDALGPSSGILLY